MFTITPAVWDGTSTRVTKTGKTPSYHQRHAMNTAEVQQREQVARGQDLVVLETLRKYGPCTPGQAWQLIVGNNPKALLSSVRRSLTNLTNRGLLLKGPKVSGPLGHPVHQWQLQNTQ